MRFVLIFCLTQEFLTWGTFIPGGKFSKLKTKENLNFQY